MKRPIHVLHIGKTGGSALKHALAPFAGDLGLIAHGHDWTLGDVPAGDKAIFIVRDPVKRFVSGFNSRLRKGFPRHVVEWTEAEALAFSRFATPNALAEGLGSADPELRDAAISAVNGIYHPARRLAFWLRSAGYVQERRGDILWIGVTDDLDEDFSRLARRLGLAESLRLPADMVKRHATPIGFETTLSSSGRKAVQDWYAQDWHILAACLEVRADIHSGDADLIAQDGAILHG